MGTGQSSVAIDMASGYPGELWLDGPHRAQPGTIVSVGTTNFNTVGFAFTQAANDSQFNVGGTGVFAGILANPKVYPLFGSSAGALAPTLNLPQYSPGEFVYDTTGIFVVLPAAAAIGDKAWYNTTTGAIVTSPAVGGSSGVAQVAIATNVATVTLVPTGSPPIGVGSVITTATGAQGQVVSLGTGTGANGTYNTIGLADHSAESFVWTGVAPSGTARCTGFEVVRKNLTAAGLGCIGNIN